MIMIIITLLIVIVIIIIIMNIVIITIIIIIILIIIIIIVWLYEMVIFRAVPIARALDLGADLVVTGRCVDSALALAPLMHSVRWENVKHWVTEERCYYSHQFGHKNHASCAIFCDCQGSPLLLVVFVTALVTALGPACGNSFTRKK